MNGMFLQGRNELGKINIYIHTYIYILYSNSVMPEGGANLLRVLFFIFNILTIVAITYNNNIKHEGGEVTYFTSAPTSTYKQNGGSNKLQLLRLCESASLEGIYLV